jgi:hypothetical protein
MTVCFLPSGTMHSLLEESSIAKMLNTVSCGFRIKICGHGSALVPNTEAGPPLKSHTSLRIKTIFAKQTALTGCKPVSRSNE